MRKTTAWRNVAKAAPALEWLTDLSGAAARVTTIGRNALLVENHTGIQTFGTDCIRLATRCGILEICGDGLSLGEVRSGSLMIRGRIQRVTLPCAEAHSDET